MARSLHKQPVHVAVKIQQEWADATARIHALIPQGPPNLVEHFAKSLTPEPIAEDPPADDEPSPEPGEEAPPTPPPPTPPARGKIPRRVKRGET